MFERGEIMKKRNLNKIIAFTLCCLIASATIVNAKATKVTKSYRYSSYSCIDPLPGDRDEK